MSTTNITMYNDQELPSLSLAWTDATGALIDFSSGWTFTVKLSRTTAPATTLYVKTTGITGSNGSTGSNLVIDWSTTDWAGLEAAVNGTSYYVNVIARRSSDTKDRYFKPDNPITLKLKAAPGTSASPGTLTPIYAADHISIQDAGSYYTGADVEAALQEAGSRLAVAVADAIQYVSTSGSNSDDGRSWGTAKLTIEAAYAALPSTGGRIELGAGTFTLAATGASTGLTITNGKPVGIRGAGRSLSTIAYGGSGIAVLVGTGVSFLDWGYLEDVTINCTNNAAATTGLSLNNCHRGYLNRVGVISGGNTVGSTGVLGTTAFQNYITNSLIYGFEDAVDLTATGNDFSIVNTSLDATGVCLRITDCHNTRIEGGQISGQPATTIGVQIDSNSAGQSYGNQILNVHFEGTLLDVKVGAAATSSQTVMSPIIMSPMPSGILLDKVMQPFVHTAMVVAGKAITLTSNVTNGVLIYALNGGSLSDSGTATTKITTAAAGALYAATMTLTGLLTGNSYKATNGAPAYDYNPSTGTGTYLRSIVGAEANERFSVIWNGQVAWGAGGASGTDLTLSRKGAGALAIGGAIAPLVGRQTLAANGAVAFDFRFGQIYVETLNANATSSSISGGTAADGQHITIIWKQDATGGRTYVWPTNCKFAANIAPSDTTPSTQTSVTFFWNNTDARWIELSRSVAVPVA